MDIEGFSKTYVDGSQALLSVGALMEGIYALGSRCYAETPRRLFAHQLGDGFVIVGEFGIESLEQATTVGILLLRQVLNAGGVAKGAISEGDFADVIGCYPSHIQDLYHEQNGGPIRIGGGMMTILPVMGTALINSYHLQSNREGPSGPLLLVDSRHRSRLSAGVKAAQCNGLVVIDWVHSSYPALTEANTAAGFPSLTAEQMKASLARYLKNNRVNDEWQANALSYLGLNDQRQL